MSISFNFEQKKLIRYGIALVLAIILYQMGDFHFGAVLAFGVGYLLLVCSEIKLNEKIPWIWTIVLFVLGAVFTVCSVQYLLLEQELFFKTTIFTLFLNVLCVLVVYLVALFLTNRVGLSAVIGHSFLIALGFVNYYVYLFRENEFIFPDLRSVGTGLSVAGNYQLELNDRGCYVILATLLFFAFARKFDIRFNKSRQMRLIGGHLIILLCVVIGLNTYYTNTETWEKKGTYRNGYILNFVLSARDSIITKPDNYTLEEIAQLEKEYGTMQKNALGDTLEKEPTIIVIMNESFADLSVIGDIKTNKPLTPFMNSLKENTIKGYALSSVFGAKTPNSEWEYMTGGSMAFFPVGSVVYQQYISETPTSIVSTLKNEGYTCVSMHPYYETGWSRHLIYPTLGFDESYFLDHFDKSQMIRKYISDRELYNKIIDRYEGRSANESLFIMSISMQNHGGYTETYDNFPEQYYKLGRSYTDANQYFSLLRESDEALEELITYFSQVDEPVEIVFFGDHQPSLTSNFYTLLNGKGLSNLTLEQLQDLYTVPFFIWTNYDTPEETVEMTSLNYLSTLTLERAGMDLPAYHQFLSDLMDVVPAINSRGYYSLEAGGYMYLDEATGEEQEWIAKYESLQYNGMFDLKNKSKIFFPYLEE